MRLRVLSLVLVAALAALAAGALLDGVEGDASPRRPPPVPGAAPVAPPPGAEAADAPAPRERPPDRFGRVEDPFAFDPDEEDRFTRRAAAGYAHPLYAQVPDGAVATARRVAAFRPLIDAAAAEHDLDADTLEAMVYLESAGFPEARAGGTEDAVGLTQILAETGRTYLGMRIDVSRSARLTRRIRRADARGRTRAAARLRAQRRRVDQRYDPRQAVAAMGRYLASSRAQLGGREDLAVVSYHMGVGNLTNLQERFGAGDDTSYAELFFDSSPLRHRRAWSFLESLNDDSKTYWWRVLAARDVMTRWRENPVALADRASRVTAKNSREELLHPVERTPRFADPQALRAAYEAGDVVGLDVNGLAGAGVRVDPDMGELARRVRAPQALYRGLRPEALALLVYLSRGVEAISGDTPLTLTSTVRDRRYQRVLLRRNAEATAGYSLHTTGWAFDVLRRYRSDAQSQAFQFMLDRLTALDLIAYVVEPAAIHITVSPRARALVPLIRRGG